MVHSGDYLALDSDDKKQKLETPIDLVLVHQTNSNPCFTKTDCITIIKEIHKHDHIDDRKHDQHNNTQRNDHRKFNFMIGGDGRVYEGMGYDFKANPHHGN